MSHLSPAADSRNGEAPVIPMAHVSSIPPVVPPALGSVASAVTPGAQVDGVTPVSMPKPFATHFVPAQQQSPIPPQIQATSVQQSNWAIQALSNVAALHSNILSMLQDADRLRQENEYLRGALRTSQTQQQLQQTQVQQMQHQIQNLQQQVQQHQQMQQFQQLQQQQQLIHQQQQQLQQQQRSNISYLPTAPVGYPVASQTTVNSGQTSSYVPVAQTPSVQNTTRQSLPNVAPPYSHGLGPADSSSTTRTQISSQQRTHATPSPAPVATYLKQGTVDVNSAVRQQNYTQMRAQANPSPSPVQYQTQQAPSRPTANAPTLSQAQAPSARQAAPTSAVPTTSRQSVSQPASVQSAQVPSRHHSAPINSGSVPNNPVSVSTHQGPVTSHQVSSHQGPVTSHQVSSHQVPVNSHQMGSHQVSTQGPSRRSSLPSSTHQSVPQMHVPVNVTPAPAPSISQSVSAQMAAPIDSNTLELCSSRTYAERHVAQASFTVKRVAAIAKAGSDGDQAELFGATVGAADRRCMLSRTLLVLLCRRLSRCQKCRMAAKLEIMHRH